MPPTSLAWVWALLWALLISPLLTLTLAYFTDNATSPQPPSSPLPDAGDEGGGSLCGGEARLVIAPRVEVTWERNSSQVVINCPSKLPTSFPLYPSFLTEPPPPPIAAQAPYLAKLGSKRRGIILNLTQLVQEGPGGQVVVDVEGCGCVGVEVGVPEWAEGVTFAIRGALQLSQGWWRSESHELRDMWVRVSEGVIMEGNGEKGGICEYLPPTLETLDLSYTPLGELVLERGCAPPTLESLQAISSLLNHVSLCTPSLTTLYLNTNEVGPDMEWAGCEGGVGGVLYLHANNNQLTSASTCSWPSLNTLELKGNWLTSLDLASCPPANLTSLAAPRNYLAVAPSPLPQALAYLDLSHNNITALPVFTHVLKEADFSYNSLREIGEERFKRAGKLHYLSLAHNHLTEIKERDFYGLKKLHRLDLSHNNLQTVAPASFLPLHSLRHLHLHHNHLTHLDARDLHALSTHSHATLHSNPWACQCQMLAALTQLQTCPECKHKRVALQCRERDHQQEVTSLLRTCLHAIRETQGPQPESDEDLSQAERGKGAGEGAGAVLIVPSLVVLIAAGVGVACGYRVYRKHRRSIASAFSPVFCGACRCCGGVRGLNNNSFSHHHHCHRRHHQQGASQLPTGELQDSDTETEM